MRRCTLKKTLALQITATLLCCAALRCDKISTDNADLSGSDDLPQAPDIASAADLSQPDLAPPADLTPPLDLAGTPGDRCVIALALPTDNTARDGTNSGFSDDYQFTATSAACNAASGSTYKGKDVVYAVAVPQAKTLTVTLTPKFISGMWYPMLALIADCAMPGPSCLGAQDTVVPNSGDRVVTYRNISGATQNLFVLVDTFDSAGMGQYSIKAALN